MPIANDNGIADVSHASVISNSYGTCQYVSDSLMAWDLLLVLDVSIIIILVKFLAGNFVLVILDLEARLAGGWEQLPKVVVFGMPEVTMSTAHFHW